MFAQIPGFIWKFKIEPEPRRFSRHTKWGGGGAPFEDWSDANFFLVFVIFRPISAGFAPFLAYGRQPQQGEPVPEEIRSPES